MGLRFAKIRGRMLSLMLGKHRIYKHIHTYIHTYIHMYIHIYVSNSQ